MKLIIADDHSVVRDGLRWMLSDREDIQIVAEAGDGSELLQVLQGQAADIVLLDVRMPGLSGLDALPEIRESHPETKVIVLSMHDEPAYVRQALSLGAAGYVLKSSGRDELIRALEEVARGGTYVQGEVAAPLAEPGADQAHGLSPRELDVLVLLAEGMENKQVARALGISEATVKTHIKSIFERLGVRSRAEAVAVGMRTGIID
jgi:DNA-binding NarL/FixJ family response regulator